MPVTRPRFVYHLFKGKPNKAGHRWYWNLRSFGNRTIVCHSEAYAKPANARHTVRRLLQTHKPYSVAVQDEMPGRPMGGRY